MARPVCASGSAGWMKSAGKLQEERIPLQEMLEEMRRMMGSWRACCSRFPRYLEWLDDVGKIPGKERQKKQLTEKMVRSGKNPSLRGRREKRADAAAGRKEDADRTAQEEIWKNKEFISKCKSESLEAGTACGRERTSRGCRVGGEFARLWRARRSGNYEYLKKAAAGGPEAVGGKEGTELPAVGGYPEQLHAEIPNRTFSATIQDNGPYDKLLESLDARSWKNTKKRPRSRRGRR